METTLGNNPKTCTITSHLQNGWLSGRQSLSLSYDLQAVDDGRWNLAITYYKHLLSLSLTSLGMAYMDIGGSYIGYFRRHFNPTQFVFSNAGFFLVQYLWAQVFNDYGKF